METLWKAFELDSNNVIMKAMQQITKTDLNPNNFEKKKKMSCLRFPVQLRVN